MSAATPTIVPVDACPLCGAQTSAVVIAEEGGLGVVRCGDCGLVHATGQYSAQFLSEDFYAGRAERAVTAAKVRPAAARKRRNVALYDRLSRGQIGRPRPGARALDIGCNTGLLLDVLRELGYHTEGIERSPAGEVALAAGHVVHALDIEAHELGLPRYDLITMTHVLEHLRRPTAGLVWVRRHLEPGGVAVVEVPNWGDRMRPLWGRRYRPLELGDHVSFFERATLRAAAEKAGLTVLQMWSAPQAGTLVVPSLLTALDMGLELRAALRGRGGQGDLPESGAGERAGDGMGDGMAVGAGSVAGPRVASGNAAGRLRRVLTPLVLAALDGLDPALERVFGAQCAWGANLVAVLGSGRS